MASVVAMHVCGKLHQSESVYGECHRDSFAEIDDI